MTLILKTLVELEAQHKAEWDALNVQHAIHNIIFESEPDNIIVSKDVASIIYKAGDIQSALALFNFYLMRDMVREMEHRGPANNRFPSLVPFHLQVLDSDVHGKYGAMIEVQYNVSSDYTNVNLVFYASVNGIVVKVLIELNASPFKPDLNKRFRGPVSTLRNHEGVVTHQYVDANMALIDSADMTFDLTYGAAVVTYGHFIYAFTLESDIKLRIENAVGNV